MAINLSYFIVGALVLSAPALYFILRNQTRSKSICVKQNNDQANYKQLIHDIADAMHNLGETPLQKDGPNESIDLSPEEVYNIRSLMRTLRKLARADMSGNIQQDVVPYKEVIALINEVAQKNVNPKVSSELITKIEDEAARQDFNSIREIVRSMSVRIPN